MILGGCCFGKRSLVDFQIQQLPLFVKYMADYFFYIVSSMTPMKSKG